MLFTLRLHFSVLFRVRTQKKVTVFNNFLSYCKFLGNLVYSTLYKLIKNNIYLILKNLTYIGCLSSFQFEINKTFFKILFSFV